MMKIWFQKYEKPDELQDKFYLWLRQKFKFGHKSDCPTSHKSDHMKVHTGQAIYSVNPRYGKVCKKT